ncbi:hybrid sensor histidine kinase/response regulator [Phenylobacterium deserti]|uniref:hybrid sensor histidine kinase/response regulator n=1 Tax=Phenylobacterium deserti TaxID=1914756 RepID=UPI00105810BE|nr:response regulator [Phenylobacterium deserti]
MSIGASIDEPPPRILIVDDIADNRAILGRRFQRRGFDIVEAESGAAALAMIEQQAVDIVLLDVMMPDMNGLEVLRRIRARFSLVELPVIMVTGKTESQDIVEALTAGANDYITKPVDFAVALLRVTTQVDRRRAEQKVQEAHRALSSANEDLERRIAERTAELVHTNAQLRVAMAEAQAANRAKDEFLVIVSHELRTPLNGMIPMGQLLARSSLDDAQRRMIDIINTSADQLGGVVSDLLDTLDLTSGGLQLHAAPVNLGSIVRGAAEPAGQRAIGKGLGFRVDIEPGAEGVFDADAQRLQQIVSKLLDNAVKFTEAGEVVLTVRRAADGGHMIEVRDTGVGFDEATRARLFRTFEQADGSLTRRFGGLGLGLAICRGLVELMGGAISAEGRIGQGAVFRVDLPLQRSAAKAA